MPDNSFNMGYIQRLKRYWLESSDSISIVPIPLTDEEKEDAVYEVFVKDYHKNPRNILLDYAGDNVTITNKKIISFLEKEIVKMKQEVTALQNFAQFSNDNKKLKESTIFFNEPFDLGYSDKILIDANTRVDAAHFLLEKKSGANSFGYDTTTKLGRARNGIKIYKDVMSAKKSIGLIIGVPIAVGSVLAPESVMDHVDICTTHIGLCSQALVAYHIDKGIEREVNRKIIPL